MAQERNQVLQNWLDKEALAESMIPHIGKLYRQNRVITTIHGRSLINQSTVSILKLHRFARQIDEDELDIAQTAPLLEALSTLNLSSASLDLALLLQKYQEQPAGTDLNTFLRNELAAIIDTPTSTETRGTDVVLYGFGRIGRLLARIMIAHHGNGEGLRLRAIVVRKGSDNDLIKRASLLRRDSVHGPFNGTISVDQEHNTITANGVQIQVIYANDPSQIDYTAYGITDALVVDNTGRWRDREGLGQHLQSKGVARVMLTAPGKGDIKNIVYGINHLTIEEDDRILSAASCTTNAIVPVLKVVHDNFGLSHGHVETVHSYTNDQNLIDNFHKGDRRGRSAALNMVLTETGAASAVAKALPELTGKLSGNAIRVPTPNVSMAILNLTLEKATTKDEVNALLREISLVSPLRQQIDFVDSPEVVSNDFIGSKTAGVVDGLATIAKGTQLVLYVWYDNEFGYSSQVIRTIEHMSGAHPKSYPVKQLPN